ncbi:MAG: phosphotransferase [Gammaproteobacteria bacterium]|nr:phosphotransferase [Gammaproteobacteria bacterium]
MARQVIQEVECADVRDHPAVKAWLGLGSKPVRPKRIYTLKEHHKMSSKSAVYRLEGIATQGGSVIAKRCRRWSALLERKIYEKILPGLSVEAPGFMGFVERAGGQYCWLFTEDVGDRWYSPLDAGHRALLGRWLGKLHVRSADMAISDLPERGPDFYYKQLLKIGAGIEQIQDTLLLNPNYRSTLRTIGLNCDVLTRHWLEIESLCNTLPRSLVHGDLVRKNLRIRTQQGSESVIAVDWENACLGVPAIDLAQAHDIKSLPDFVASPELTGYWSVVRNHWQHLDRRDLERLAEVGTLFRCLDALVWEIERLEADGYIDRCMQRMKIFRSLLDESLRTMKWLRP